MEPENLTKLYIKVYMYRKKHYSHEGEGGSQNNLQQRKQYFSFLELKGINCTFSMEEIAMFTSQEKG